MRMLVTAKFCHKAFNELAKAGTVGQKMKAILEDLKPESVYFTEFGGRRTAVMVIDLPDASKIPAIAEPFFLQFNADVEFHPCMTPEDLGPAGLESLGKKWA